MTSFVLLGGTVSSTSSMRFAVWVGDGDAARASAIVVDGQDLSHASAWISLVTSEDQYLYGKDNNLQP